MQEGMISILLPVYEMKGHGKVMLERAVDSIIRQKVRDGLTFEVIVVDSAPSFGLEQVFLQNPKASGLSVKYVHYPDPPGTLASKLNIAFGHSRGEFVTFLMQDDFYLSETALDSIPDGLRGDSFWQVCHSIHTKDGVSFFHENIASYNRFIHLGKNRISDPSVVSLRRTAWVDFDVRLKWLVDVEFYKRLGVRWGRPNIIPAVNVAIGVGPHQATNFISGSRRALETMYCSLKHLGVTFT